MKGLFYQIKNIRRDKMCILTFLLPVIAGLAINLLSDVSFSAIVETSFGVVQNDLTEEMIGWLEQNGSIKVFESIEDLQRAVIDPATQMIGVLRNGNTIKAILSGDELQLYKTIGNTISSLFSKREAVIAADIKILPAETNQEWLKSLLVVITMVTAMFMGCTFNAMSIIGEKEDGIAFINEILPMTGPEYMLQKIILGLGGSILSTVLTALICIQLETAQIFTLLLLIVISAFISALAGLFIGQLSSGLMVGIVYIKMIMILFIAPPILFYLAAPADSIVRTLSYILPSSATFYGLMDLMNGQMQNLNTYLVILLIHCFVWLFLFLSTIYRRKIFT